MAAQRIIGLLGGSFDPAHAGHVEITRHALRRFGLDRVWWMVSPANPLKTTGPDPLLSRIRAAKRVMEHPKVNVTGIESDLGTRFTSDTIAALKQRFAQYRFVWLMGADNLNQFHKWHAWETIMNSVPIGILARSGDQMAPLNARASRIYRAARLPGYQSQLLGRQSAPCWCYLPIPMKDISSTRLRLRAAHPAGREAAAE